MAPRPAPRVAKDRAPLRVFRTQRMQLPSFPLRTPRLRVVLQNPPRTGGRHPRGAGILGGRAVARDTHASHESPGEIPPGTSRKNISLRISCRPEGKSLEPPGAQPETDHLKHKPTQPETDHRAQRCAHTRKLRVTSPRRGER